MANLPGGSDDRRYTDREMKLIFERADEADVEAQGEGGHTLAEMQEIARQVGLSPDDIAKAASTLRAPAASFPLLGAPVRFRASRMLPVKLTEDDVTNVAIRIRHFTGFHGELRNVPVLVGLTSAAVGAVAAIRLWWPRVASRWAKRTDALMQSIGDAAETGANPGCRDAAHFGHATVHVVIDRAGSVGE